MKMADIINKFYRKIANNGNDSDYELIGTIGVNGIELAVLRGCSASTNGQQGLVPAPASGYQNRILTGDATWKTVNTLLSNSGMIKNNLTTASSGLILDAYQGKVLNDKITSTNSTVSSLNSKLTTANNNISSNTKKINTANSNITTLNNKFTTANVTSGGWSGSKIYLSKAGSMVAFVFTGVFALPSANKEYSVISIPSGYRPSRAGFVRFPVHCITSHTVIGQDYITIKNTGEVVYSTSQAGSYERYCAGCYPI